MKIVRLEDENDLLYIVTQSKSVMLKDGAEGKVISHLCGGNVCVKFKHIDEPIYVPENLLEALQ